MQYKRIVLNEPHASVEGLYDNQLSFWNIDERFINDIVLKWTDWHTDFLFHGYRGENVKTVRFPYSRFIVDAERLWDDPLEQHGQGIVYKQFDGYTRTVPEETRSNSLVYGIGINNDSGIISVKVLCFLTVLFPQWNEWCRYLHWLQRGLV